MLGNLGNTYKALGDLGKAVAHLEQALGMYQQLGLLEGQGAALGNLGSCYKALGSTAKAKESFEKALTVLRRVGLGDDHPHVKMVLQSLAKMARAARGT
jgi:tetratricopeptide (TPR) repeat protein